MVAGAMAGVKAGVPRPPAFVASGALPDGTPLPPASFDGPVEIDNGAPVKFDIACAMITCVEAVGQGESNGVQSATGEEVSRHGEGLVDKQRHSVTGTAGGTVLDP